MWHIHFWVISRGDIDSDGHLTIGSHPAWLLTEVRVQVKYGHILTSLYLYLYHHIIIFVFKAHISRSQLLHDFKYPVWFLLRCIEIARKCSWKMMSYFFAYCYKTQKLGIASWNFVYNLNLVLWIFWLLKIYRNLSFMPVKMLWKF